MSGCLYDLDKRDTQHSLNSFSVFAKKYSCADDAIVLAFFNRIATRNTLSVTNLNSLMYTKGKCLKS
jgi:hypothetical protein